MISTVHPAGVRDGFNRRVAVAAGEGAGRQRGGAAGVGAEGHGALRDARRARARAAGRLRRVGALRRAEARPLHHRRAAPQLAHR